MKTIKTTSRKGSGFTLVEVLTVMVLLALMGGMVVAAVRGVTETAREARTKSIIAAVDAVIQEQYESYKFRPLPVEVPDVYRPGTRSGTEVGYDVLATEAARVRLMMIRDLQRMEMPDRFTDITVELSLGDPSVIRAAVNPVIESGGVIVASRNDPAQRRMMDVNWFGYLSSSHVPGKLAAYRDRIPTSDLVRSSSPMPTTAELQQIDRNLENQGAECLFLIMSTSFVAGTPAIDVIPTANIGDTDDDGFLEILDGWGQPLIFVRWPVGYYDFEGAIDTAIPDEFDLFRSDYAYIAPTTNKSKVTDVNYFPSPNTLPGHASLKTNPWSIRPLIMSVGSDGEAGIATNPWTSGGVEQKAFAYRSATWNWDLTTPVTTSDEYYGAEGLGRDRGVGTATYSTHPFLDPFMRVFVDVNTPPMGTFGGLLPGQQLATTTAFEERSDNISNYELRASE
tara:strand:- start:13084 stop:14439 length:1356 start_codon:yes stop_codon:yes gene_type:complete